MKYFMVCVALLLAGCGESVLYDDSELKAVRAIKNYNVSSSDLRCVDGVVYMKVAQQYTAKFNRNSEVETCGGTH